MCGPGVRVCTKSVKQWFGVSPVIGGGHSEQCSVCVPGVCTKSVLSVKRGFGVSPVIGEGHSEQGSKFCVCVYVFFE